MLFSTINVSNLILLNNSQMCAQINIIKFYCHKFQLFTCFTCKQVTVRGNTCPSITQSITIFIQMVHFRSCPLDRHNRDRMCANQQMDMEQTSASSYILRLMVSVFSNFIFVFNREEHSCSTEPPRFPIPTQSLSAQKDKPARLFCQAEGDRPIRMEWSLSNGTLLNELLLTRDHGGGTRTEANDIPFK